ncbi:trinucleotide repeat-containing gene 6A protein-like isoform X1, partial [Lates japonicus]
AWLPFGIPSATPLIKQVWSILAWTHSPIPGLIRSNHSRAGVPVVEMEVKAGVVEEMVPEEEPTTTGGSPKKAGREAPLPSKSEGGVATGWESLSRVHAVKSDDGTATWEALISWPAPCMNQSRRGVHELELQIVNIHVCAWSAAGWGEPYPNRESLNMGLSLLLLPPVTVDNRTSAWEAWTATPAGMNSRDSRRVGQEQGWYQDKRMDMEQYGRLLAGNGENPGSRHQLTESAMDVATMISSVAQGRGGPQSQVPQPYPGNPITPPILPTQAQPLRPYLDNYLSHNTPEMQKDAAALGSFSNFPLSLNSNLNVSLDMGVGGGSSGGGAASYKEPPQSRLKKLWATDPLEQNSKPGAMSSGLRLEDSPFYDFLVPAGGMKDYPKLTLTLRRPRDPASVINNLSSAVHDTRHLRDRNNGPSSSLNTRCLLTVPGHPLDASSHSGSLTSTSTKALQPDPVSQRSGLPAMVLCPSSLAAQAGRSPCLPRRCLWQPLQTTWPHQPKPSPASSGWDGSAPEGLRGYRAPPESDTHLIDGFLP